MFGRENLIWEYAEDFEEPDEKVYRIEEVNEVMDKMESRIKELESDLSMMETDYEFRIKNTVKVLKNTELQLHNRIKELEDDWQKTYAEECITRHENHRLVERIEELEKENNQLKQELEGTYNLLAHNLGIGNYGN